MHQCMDKSASLPTTERILRSRVNLVQHDTTLKQLKLQKQMYNLHQLWKVTLNCCLILTTIAPWPVCMSDYSVR